MKEVKRSKLIKALKKSGIGIIKGYIKVDRPFNDIKENDPIMVALSSNFKSLGAYRLQVYDTKDDIIKCFLMHEDAVIKETLFSPIVSIIIKSFPPEYGFTKDIGKFIAHGCPKV